MTPVCYALSFWQAQELKAKFGEVSILVNNAGTVTGGSIIGCHTDDIEHTVNVNTLAHVWVSLTSEPTA